jgi:hypothetical protein
MIAVDNAGNSTGPTMHDNPHNAKDFIVSAGVAPTITYATVQASESVPEYGPGSQITMLAYGEDDVAGGFEISMFFNKPGAAGSYVEFKCSASNNGAQCIVDKPAGVGDLATSGTYTYAYMIAVDNAGNSTGPTMHDNPHNSKDFIVSAGVT